MLDWNAVTIKRKKRGLNMKKKMMKLFIGIAALFALPLSVSAEEVTCNHKWSAWEIQEEATCDQNGYMWRECSECYKYEEKVIPATGIHKWSAWKVEEEALCTENGYMSRECSECYKYEEKDIPATGIHKWSAWEVWDKPDCSNPGEQSRYCKDCYDEQTKVIPKNPKAHDWTKWYAIKSATIFKKGTQERFCSTCMKEETKAIAKLKPFVKFSKKTVNLRKSQKQTLKITFAKGDSIKSWKTSNKKIVTVTKKGKITAKKNGTAKITVKMKSGKKATCTIKVSNKKKASSTPSKSKTVYWTSGGSVYHSTKKCPSLSRSKSIKSGSVSKCPKKRSCKVCY